MYGTFAIHTYIPMGTYLYCVAPATVIGRRSGHGYAGRSLVFAGAATGVLVMPARHTLVPFGSYVA